MWTRGINVEFKGVQNCGGKYDHIDNIVNCENGKTKGVGMIFTLGILKR